MDHFLNARATTVANTHIPMPNRWPRWMRWLPGCRNRCVACGFRYPCLERRWHRHGARNGWWPA